MNQTQVTRGSGLLEGFLARQRAKMAERLIPSSCRDGTILDVGCGSYPLFLSHTDFRAKIGLDKVVTASSNPLLAEQGIRFIQHDFVSDTTLPLESDSCTVATMLAVIEHIDPDRAVRLLREVHRVLEPGGFLILTTPAAWVDLILRFMARLGLVSSEEIDEHKAAYNHRRLRAVLAEVFPENGIQCGFFEMFMNIWAVAQKQNDSPGRTLSVP